MLLSFCCADNSGQGVEGVTVEPVVSLISIEDASDARKPPDKEKPAEEERKSLHVSVVEIVEAPDHGEDEQREEVVKQATAITLEGSRSKGSLDSPLSGKCGLARATTRSIQSQRSMDSRSKGREPGKDEQREEVVKQATAITPEGSRSKGSLDSPFSGRSSLARATTRSIQSQKSMDSRSKGRELGKAILERRGTAALDTAFNPHGGLRPLDRTKTNINNADNIYDTQQLLGEGGFGKVMLVKNKSSGESFAMKIINAVMVDDHGRFETELEISRKLQHPNIVTLHDFFREPTVYKLVMTLCVGGDLLQKVADSMSPFGGGLLTRDVARYTWQMLSGLAYLHHYSIVHRDIKCENFMLVNDKDSSPIQLIDFGLARQFQKGEPMFSAVGTLEYTAPEILFGSGYDERVDIWSAGITVFVMSSALMPLSGSDPAQTMDAVRAANYHFNNDRWKCHPQELRDLITKMLTKEPANRLSAKLLLEDKWLVRKQEPEQGCCAIS